MKQSRTVHSKSLFQLWFRRMSSMIHTHFKTVTTISIIIDSLTKRLASSKWNNTDTSKIKLVAVTNNKRHLDKAQLSEQTQTAIFVDGAGFRCDCKRSSRETNDDASVSLTHYFHGRLCQHKIADFATGIVIDSKHATKMIHSILCINLSFSLEIIYNSMESFWIGLEIGLFAINVSSSNLHVS